jgi:hypothetical protein
VPRSPASGAVAGRSAQAHLPAARVAGRGARSRAIAAEEDVARTANREAIEGELGRRRERDRPVAPAEWSYEPLRQG